MRRTSTLPGRRARFKDSEPFAANVLVLAIAAKALPAGLAKAVKSRSREIDTSPGSQASAHQWLSEQLQTAPVHLDRPPHLLEATSRGRLAPARLFEILTRVREGARLTRSNSNVSRR